MLKHWIKLIKHGYGVGDYCEANGVSIDDMVASNAHAAALLDAITRLPKKVEVALLVVWAMELTGKDAAVEFTKNVAGVGMDEVLNKLNSVLKSGAE